MIDLVGALADLVLALRTASRTMLGLRLAVLASGGAAVMVALLLGGGFWLATLFAVMAGVGVLAAAVAPASSAPTFAIGVLVVQWLLGGRVPLVHSLTLGVVLALFHLLCTLACRGPLYAQVRRGALSARPWLLWAVGSALGMALVSGIAALPSTLLPRGIAWIAAGLACAVVGLIVLLVRAARTDQPS